MVVTGPFHWLALPPVLDVPAGTGGRVEAGETVSAVVASAKRDEAVFSDPDRFDIRRTGSALASFGREFRAPTSLFATLKR